MNLIICILGLTAMALANDNELSTMLKQGNDQFTAQMFYQVAKENTDKSVILSAFSVLSPLAQLAVASVGASHDELLKAIGLPNDNVTKAVFADVNRQLRTVKGVELNMANRIYIAQNAQLNKQFAVSSKDAFNSDVKNIDFSKNEEATSEINAWVEDQTNHKIKKLLNPSAVDSATRAILVNAIYFKGLWKHKFDKNLTTNHDFHVSKSQTVKVPTMSIKKSFRYGESAELDAKLLEMPYEGYEATFLIVLPNKVDGITDLKEKLKDASLLNKAIQEMNTNEVDVLLPKFKIETTTDLKKVLQEMNINKIFGPDARLENLLENESNLFISGAIQKAFIEVNEEGAEAAAANEFGVSYLSALIPVLMSFKADHPFVFYLKKDAYILFSGVYQS